MQELDINTISAIGELKSFAMQQSSTNARLLTANDRMIDEIRKLADAVSENSKLSATFVEYRNVLHERFDHIHRTELKMDERIENLYKRTDIIENTILEWRTMLRSASVITFILSTTFGAVISQVIPLLIKMF